MNAEIAPLLKKIRLTHPFLAILLSLGLFHLCQEAYFAAKNSIERRLSVCVLVLVVGQIAVGALNILLVVPTWVQLTHLLLANMLWVVMLLLGAEQTVARERSVFGSQLSPEPNSVNDRANLDGLVQSVEVQTRRTAIK